MKKNTAKIFTVISLLCFIAMFFVDGEGAFLDNTTIYMYELAVCSVITATLGLNIRSFPSWKRIVLWGAFVLIVIFSVNPLIHSKSFKAVENPGNELPSPPQLEIMYNGSRIQAHKCAYKWYCEDYVLVEQKGFSGWIRIGSLGGSTLKYDDRKIVAVMNFSSLPDEYDIRYWKDVDWNIPSDIGKILALDEENCIKIRSGYYRVTAHWKDYGYVVYGFIIK